MTISGSSGNTWIINAIPTNIKNPIYGAAGDGITDDTAAISAAIAAINAAGTGILDIPPGTYITQGNHNITVPCIIRGAGRGTIGSNQGVSVLSLKNGSNASMINVQSKLVCVRDLGLYGNLAQQTATSYGITTSSSIACNYFVWENLWIDNFFSDGMLFANPGTSLGGALRNIESRNHGGHGLVIGAGCADITITDSLFDQNQLSGMYINAADISCTNVHCWGNGKLATAAGDSAGMLMPSGAPGECRFQNCYFESNGLSSNSGRGAVPRGTGNIFIGCHIYLNRGLGCYAFSNTAAVWNGCVFHDNNLNNASGASGAGLQLDTCTTCVVTGNTFFDAQGTKTQTYGYAENGNTCNACIFNGNVSRAADHKTGAWLIGLGNPTATLPALPGSYNQA
jgi:Pectate lyase superfamily protein